MRRQPLITLSAGKDAVERRQHDEVVSHRPQHRGNTAFAIVCAEHDANCDRDLWCLRQPGRLEKLTLSTTA